MRLHRVLLIGSIAAARTFGWSVASATAQDDVKVVIAPAARADDSAILPYLDEGTFLVARLDVDKVDRDALGQYMNKAFEAMAAQMPAQFRAQIQAQMAQQVETAKTWLKDMSDAGGKHVYVVFDAAGAESSDGPAAVIPLREDSDEEKIKDLLQRTANGSGTLEKIGNAMVIGEARVVTRLKERVAKAPAPRQDMTKALSAGGGDAPLHVAVVPGESGRKWVEENLPALPPELGGGETSLISRGVKFASFTVSQKPKTVMNLAVHCENADKAKAIMDALDKGRATAKEKVKGTPQAEQVNKRLEAIQPKLAGDTITASVDPIDLQILMTGIAEPRAVVDNGQPAEPAKKDDGGL
jgi:hypothetical protein